MFLCHVLSNFQEQSKVLWTFRDNLQKQVSNNALKGLLEYNKQKLPSGESKVGKTSNEKMYRCRMFQNDLLIFVLLFASEL